MSQKNVNDTESSDFDLDSFLNETDAPPKLTDKEIDAFEAFLESQPGSMHMEILDGFFCGLICGPDTTDPEEFLNDIFGGKAPVFASASQEEEIKHYLNQYWNHIEGMMKSSDAYYPFLYSDHEFKVSGNDWALGFVLGIDKFKGSWKLLLEQSRKGESLLNPILTLYMESSPENTEGLIHAEDREEVVTTIINNLPKIYHFFSAERGGGE